MKIIPVLLVLCGFSSMVYADGEEPIPSYYQEPGISRTRDYTDQHANERIDPFTGKLQWHFTDLFIPGNGGLDLKVSRSYNSMNEQLIYEDSPAGLGWTMHAGRVLRNSTTSICDTANNGPTLNPILETPDGGRRILYFGMDQASWITTDFWKAQCHLSGTEFGLDVFSPDGTRYEMTARGVDIGTANHPTAAYYLAKVVDRNGNWIKYTYNFSTGYHLMTGATTSDGRAFIINYNGNNLIDTITDGTVNGSGYVTAGNRVWTYIYNAVPAVYNTFYLKEVKRPDGASWKFDYNDAPVTDTPGGFSMRQATYPGGGTINYTYDFVYFASLSTALPRSTVVKTKVASPGGTWNWTYTPATQQIVPDQNGGFNFSMPPAAGTEVMLDRTTVVGPDENRTHYHIGYNSSYSGITYLIGSSLGTVTADQVEAYGFTAIQISNQTNVRPGNNLVFDNVTSAPLTTAHNVGRPGESFATSYGNFDAFGNPQTIVEQGTDKRTTNLTYYNDPAKWIIRLKQNETATVGTESIATTREFDANANLMTETHAGVPTSFTYTAEGDLASRTDARNKVTLYSDYYRGIARAESQPESVGIARVVSSDGNIVSETDGELSTIGFSYDGLNRVTGITHPLGNPVTVAWTPTTRTVTRGAYSQVTTYDGFGRAASVQHTDTGRAESVLQTYKVDSLGRRTFASYPNAGTGTMFGLDTLGRVKTTFNEYNPSNGAWTSLSQKLYQSYKVYLTNERSYNFVYAYRTFGDADKGELMSIVTDADAGGPGTVMTRNVAGQMTSVTQDGVTRNYGYDTHFFLTSTTEPETGVTTMGRDAVGNMTTRKVGASAETGYVYDDRNRLTAINYAAGTPSVVKTYYKDDKEKVIDNGVAKWEDVYDANKNLKSETLTIGARTFLTKYDYNGNDALATLTYGSNKVVDYAPDAFGRARQAAPYVTAVAYHPTGMPSSLTYANGVQTTIGINTRQWPSSLKIAKSGNNLFDMGYLYDDVGNVTSIGDNVDSSYNRSMFYDQIDRLRTADGPWGSGSIVYDLRGNITSQSFGGFNLTYTYDATHRLASVSGSKPYALNYDAYGNVIGNGTTTFGYNDASNMRCAKCGTPDEILYDYDGMSQRIRMQKGASQTFFVHGHGGQLLWEETPGSMLKEYIYLGGKQVATREQKLP